MERGSEGVTDDLNCWEGCNQLPLICRDHPIDARQDKWPIRLKSLVRIDSIRACSKRRKAQFQGLL